MFFFFPRQVNIFQFFLLRLCSGMDPGPDSFSSVVYVFFAFDSPPLLSVSANLRFLSLPLVIVCPYRSTVHPFLSLLSQQGHFSCHDRVFVHLVKKRKCEQGDTVAVLVLLLMQPPTDSNTKDWKDTMFIPSQKKRTNKFFTKTPNFPARDFCFNSARESWAKVRNFLKMSARESQKAAQDSQNKASKRYSLWAYLTINTVGFLFRLSM